MGFYLVPINYDNIENEEKTVSINTGVSNVEVSVSPIPYTNDCCLTLIEDGKPLVINQICILGEEALKNIIFDSKFKGDFLFLPIGLTFGKFERDRLGKDVFLYYVDGEDYES